MEKSIADDKIIVQQAVILSSSFLSATTIEEKVNILAALNMLSIAASMSDDALSKRLLTISKNLINF